MNELHVVIGEELRSVDGGFDDPSESDSEKKCKKFLPGEICKALCRPGEDE